MNYLDSVHHLARTNALKCAPSRNEDMNHTMPFFQIRKNDVGKLDIEGYNYSRHDNKNRMIFWEQYMRNAILPNIKNKDEICGFYQMELHDSINYLIAEKYHPENTKYDNVFTFCKKKDNRTSPLLPDIYFMINWNNKTYSDTISYEQKDDKVLFYGTTTGSMTPKNNLRLQLCQWAIGKQNYDFKITNIAQMKEKDIVEFYGVDKWSQMFNRTRVSPEQQMKSKFLLNIDGNCSRWDIWDLKTKCLSFKYFSDEMLFYYPLLRNKEHFVEVSKENMENMRLYYKNNHEEAIRISQNANAFAEEFFTPYTHITYTIKLFESIAENK